MPFTASKTDAWTMAAWRVITSGVEPPMSAARKNIWFQSVTSSARAEAGRRTARAMGTSRIAWTSFLIVTP
jgi:hypothetical protein